MVGTTITVHVNDPERDELVAHAPRVQPVRRVRVRLGLRVQGTRGDANVQVDPSHVRPLEHQITDRELPLRALERVRA